MKGFVMAALKKTHLFIDTCFLSAMPIPPCRLVKAAMFVLLLTEYRQSWGNSFSTSSCWWAVCKLGSIRLLILRSSSLVVAFL
ncbi:hypothetical protein F0562_019977 [Nyssa sinensis]|uniref:Uncharacterized protein n=1 Tax=Nyssa sinensis TaxID=561372 RepID=A0A5J5BR41_9ASTE|nr:hypothetical protein F0562_019977 [Nyssa sinensis]